MTAEPLGERLNRYLARRGVTSRRGADGLIAAGRVAVNGRPATPGLRVAPGDGTVTVDGVAVSWGVEPVTLMLNKPVGVVTTRHDPQGRRTVMNLVPPAPGLVPVGRLDADSRGLLLLSNDGELVHRLSHPRHRVSKRYRVRLAAAIAQGQLEGLRRGARLEDGWARPLGVRRVSARVVELAMGEGRKREIRRLCAALELTVLDLQRIAVGPLTLGGLAEGECRPLGVAELAGLRRSAGLAPEPSGAGRPDGGSR